YQTYMEYTVYASRFRVYNASRAGISISGINQNPPPPFRVNILAYNTDTNGSYGSVSFTSSTYLYGSLIAYQINVNCVAPIEKQSTEQGVGEDRLTYAVNSWKELP